MKTEKIYTLYPGDHGDHITQGNCYFFLFKAKCLCNSENSRTPVHLVLALIKCCTALKDDTVVNGTDLYPESLQPALLLQVAIFN